MKIELVPFSTPNYVLMKIPRSGLKDFSLADFACEPPKFALAELDAEDLSKLCDDFRVEIFKKAGKDDPKLNPSKYANFNERDPENTYRKL